MKEKYVRYRKIRTVSIISNSWMDKCVAEVQNRAYIPSEKDEAFPPVFRLPDEAFPPVFRLPDEAFPFDLGCMGVSSERSKYQAVIYEFLVGFNYRII
jgi:hypothetical protein